MNCPSRPFQAAGTLSLRLAIILFVAVGGCRALWAQSREWAAASDRTLLNLEEWRMEPPMREHAMRSLRVGEVAEPRGRFIASYAPYTHHTGKGNYNSRPNLRSFEWESASQWTVGGTSFSNSFHQPCWYAFAGKRFQLKHRSGRFFAKVTGGIIYGYKPPHQDAIPLNYRGYNPALIPSLGYQYGNVSFQLMVFGRAWGAMPVFGVDLR